MGGGFLGPLMVLYTIFYLFLGDFLPYFLEYYCFIYCFYNEGFYFFLHSKKKNIVNIKKRWFIIKTFFICNGRFYLMFLGGLNDLCYLYIYIYLEKCNGFCNIKILKISLEAVSL